MTDPDPRIELADLTRDADVARVVEALDVHRIVVRASHARSQRPADQAALYNLVNLASRLFAHVEIDVGEAPWEPPLPGADTLAASLDEVSQRVGPPAAAAPRADIVLSWGGDPPAGGIAGDAAGWTYTIGTERVALNGAGDGPAFGALAASSLMAGQAFGRALGPLGMATHPVTLVVANLLDYRNRLAPPGEAITWPLLERAIVAGSGSVGSSLVYCALLADIPGGPLVVIDPDEFSGRNALRYPIIVGAASGPKATWLQAIAAPSGLVVEPHVMDVRGWHAAQAAPRAEPLVLSSVDTVEGRMDATDILAEHTVNSGVSAMALHVAGHGFDDRGCAFCPYIDTEPALSGAAMLAQAIGLPAERVIALHHGGGRLMAEDVELIARAGVLNGVAPSVGDRLDDLRRRAYAQAGVPTGGGRVLVSAPHVSAMAGLLMLGEAVKVSTPSLRPSVLLGRFDLDMSGEPGGFTLPARRDVSRRCLCWSGFRRRAHRRLHGLAPRPADAPS